MGSRSPLVGLLLALACGGEGAGDRGEADGGAERDSSFVFDESEIRTFELTVAPADWDFLNDDPRLEQYVPADLSYAGATFSDIGVRYKGAVGSLGLCFDQQGNQICDKLSFKLKLNEYVPGQRLYGLNKINLHSMEKDPSKMHDAIGYKLFRDAGVFAPRTAYARVVVNGELVGLFVAVEAIDGRFTRQRFPDGGEGNVYKEVWPVHLTEQPYLDALKTNEDDLPPPSADKMVRFARALAGADASTFESVISEWTDVDMLMRHQAVARLIDHWDGIVGWYCVGGTCFNHNYYWYESTAADQVWLIPWDLDHTFEEPSPIRTNFGMPDWDDTDADCAPIPVFLGIEGRAPACDTALLRPMVTVLWDRYVAESRALLAGPFAPSAIDARIAELETLIAGAVAEDPDLDPGAWAAAVEALRAAVDAKRTHVEAKLP